MEQAIKTPRTAAGRPVTTASGRYVRLGTVSQPRASDIVVNPCPFHLHHRQASMLQDESGAFINVAKLDLPKYAKRPALAKALFLYLLHVDEQPVKALELAAHATEHQEYQDHWWKGMPALHQDGAVFSLTPLM
jgi:tetratricopeptide repeat protein 8